MIAWRAWPLRRRPLRGALGAALAAGTVGWVAAWGRDPWLVGLAAAVLAAAVAPFFVPTSYRLGPEGVEIRRPWRRRLRPWADFRGVLAGRDLVVLAPFGRRTWLDGLRGETLLLEDNRSEVLEYVETMVGREAERGPARGNA